jgi:hypothetical protein
VPLCQHDSNGLAIFPVWCTSKQVVATRPAGIQRADEAALMHTRGKLVLVVLLNMKK